MRSIGEAELREMYPAPEALVVSKQLTHLDKHCLHFMSLAPLVLIGTRSKVGQMFPRGAIQKASPTS